MCLYLYFETVSSMQGYLFGTFRMSPRLWKQVLIINVELDDHLSFPVIFVLLPNKKTESYKKAFDEIRKLLQDLELPPLAATQAMADFEQAIRLSWAEVFPNIPLKNCLFHFNKVIIYHLDINGLYLL